MPARGEQCPRPKLRPGNATLALHDRPPADPLRLRRHPRKTQRRQVDAAQHPAGREGGSDHLETADDPPRGAGDLQRGRPSDRVRGHPRIPPGQDRPGPLHESRGPQRHGRCRDRSVGGGPCAAPPSTKTARWRACFAIWWTRRRSSWWATRSMRPSTPTRPWRSIRTCCPRSTASTRCRPSTTRKRSTASGPTCSSGCPRTRSSFPATSAATSRARPGPQS